MTDARRTTLGALDTNQGAVVSKLGKAPPVAGAGPRMSLAPRMSAIAPRRSSVAPLSPRRRSIAGRRSVVGRMSLAPGAAPALKDSRLRVKNARAVMEAKLTAFLEQTGFTMAGWTPRLVHEPTQSAFVAMFRHVYRECIDATYVLGADGRKFEEEVMQLLRDVRYPFLEELTKTKLMAAGSQPHWPACLAMLDWLVRLGSEVATIGSGPLERADDNELHALFFPYLWRCYAKFWDNQDTYPEDTAALQAAFRAKNDELARQVAALEHDKQALDAEHDALTARASPLAREQHESEVLQGDIAKFTQYRDAVLAPKLDKTRRTIGRLHTALVEAREELDAKQAERARQQALVDAQDVSADEFARMASERDALATERDALAQTHRATLERCWKHEVELARRQTDVDARVRQIEPAARRATVWPLPREDGGAVEALALCPSQAATMLPPGVEMRTIVAHIDSARAAQHERLRTLAHERGARQEALDTLLEQLAAQRRQRRSVESRLEALRAQLADVARTMSDEEQVAHAEAERQEELVRTIAHASQVALQQAEARKAAAELQLQEAIVSTDAERATMHDEMCNALHTLLDLKVRVAEGLDTVAAAVHAASAAAAAAPAPVAST